MQEENNQEETNQNENQGLDENVSSPFDINTVISDAKKIVTQPRAFYRDMPRTGGFTNPLLFVVSIAIVMAVVGLALSLIGLLKYSPMMGAGIGFAALIMAPIVAVIGSFIGAAIVFVIWKLMGSTQNYETAYRCVAYTFAIAPIIAVISIIPYLGGIAQTCWSVFLLYVASVEVHQIKEQTAKIVFGILGALSVISNISTERTARYYEAKFADVGSSFERAFEDGKLARSIEGLENIDDMSPEEAGKELGAFLKGMDEFSKGLEESLNEADEDSEKQN